MWRIAVAASLIWAASAQTRVLSLHDAHDVLYDPATACASIWSSKGLLGVVYHPGSTDGPLIFVLKSDGNIDYTPFSIPGGRYYLINGVAERPDGGVEIVGRAGSNEGNAIDFIAHTAPDGIVTTVVVTTPYEPLAVTVAQDGVVWTVGTMHVPRTSNVLKRFSPTGRLLSTAHLNAGGYWTDAATFSVLRASRDRVGWLSSANDYFEFALDGSELLHIAGPPDRTDRRPPMLANFVMSESNEVLAGGSPSNFGPDRKLWTLIRGRVNRWTEVKGETPERGANLFGFDGHYLVASGSIILPGAAPRQAIKRYILSAP